VLAFLLACCSSAFALDPSLDVSQYGHTSWKVRDGFFKAGINSIAQTPDGYLWLGSQFGLSRFDGVKSVAWQPPPGQQLPSSHIFSLLAARDGTLWIGTAKGLASWKDGKLTQYAELAGHYIFKILFRYKLEGYDTDWQDAGNRRLAIYTNLQPRNYRFRVMACNNSGVWNETGTFLDFSIAPAYYQATWFRVSLVIAFLFVLAQTE